VGPEAALTVDAALLQARSLGLARLDAQLLVGAVLRCDRSWLMSHGEHVLTHKESQELELLLRRRAEGVPMAYLLGHREFHGLRLRVTPDVLDPRPDTETLVDWALAQLEVIKATSLGPVPANAALAVKAASIIASPHSAGLNGPRVLDLGTGSGAIALAIKNACQGADVHASDASAAALAVARGNAAELGLAVTFHEGSWWQAVGGLRFDVVVSNPPYIREDDPHLAALLHEPRAALVAGEQGLADIRAIIEGARGHLNLGAWLLLEHGFDQGPAVAALLRDAGFVEIDHRLDLAGHTRCTGGRLPR
jgi:release factor glutamine methyltransferase